MILKVLLLIFAVTWHSPNPLDLLFVARFLFCGGPQTLASSISERGAKQTTPPPHPHLNPYSACWWLCSSRKSPLTMSANCSTWGTVLIESKGVKQGQGGSNSSSYALGTDTYYESVSANMPINSPFHSCTHTSSSLQKVESISLFLEAGLPDLIWLVEYGRRDVLRSMSSELKRPYGIHISSEKNQLPCK